MNSYWIDSTKNLDKDNPIDNDYMADVCIIGAGLTGLTTGYYLTKKGLKVIIVDKNFIGTRASGHTTAKITLGHNLIYNYLINSYGKELAKGYFESNKQAISNIKEIIDSENLDCDFEYQSNYIFATDESEIKQIKDEVNAINLLARR